MRMSERTCDVMIGWLCEYGTRDGRLGEILSSFSCWIERKRPNTTGHGHSPRKSEARGPDSGATSWWWCVVRTIEGAI